MGWSDCLKPASFDECTLRPILSPFSFLNPLTSITGQPQEEEGLWGYENELKVLIFLGLGYGLYKISRVVR